MKTKPEWDTKLPWRGKPASEMVQFAKEHHFASDAYSFAEWLTQSQDYYGDIEHMPEGEMEMAYEEAMGLWQRYSTSPGN
jgi:hypothetical protein